MSERLGPRAGEAIRRDWPISFDFEGRPVSAFEGDTIGSALAAAGVTITSRSFKYHRARGLCGSPGTGFRNAVAGIL